MAAIPKKDLRLVVRAKLHAITPEQRVRASALACARLREQKVWAQVKSVMFYSALIDVLDFAPLFDVALASGKSVALPKFVEATKSYVPFKISHAQRDCAAGKFGIIEPAATCAEFPANHLDLILVPGVAFDVTGHRLGRGQGHYDRLLANVVGIKCGVAFDEQLVQRIPAEAHDIRMNCVLTPTRFIEFA
ncbi:MAG: 5-formyltetrahydrofolate cyclo-ligase [Verrucomicrobiales bacterium]|nr:5-formyltetrahydrofolate cyclo-ligase [Verrucomicrobiales bacterium]